MKPEAKLWKRIKPWFNRHGVATRIENTATSGFPDVCFVAHQTTFFIELKIADGYRIKLQPFQIAFHTRLWPYINRYGDWFFVEMSDKSVRCYPWNYLQDFPRNKGGVVSLKGIPHEYTMKNQDGFELWLDSNLRKTRS